MQEDMAMTNGCCGGRQTRTAEREISPAIAILEERFARGEIEKAEFEEKRQIISRSREKRPLPPQGGEPAAARPTRASARLRIRRSPIEGCGQKISLSTTSTRTVGLLGAIFAYAVRPRMRPDNLVHGVMRLADGRRERRLSDEEYRALGEALRAAETSGMWPAAIAAARFLALTGWRSGEVLGLRWVEVDLGRRTTRLSDTKSGRSIRPLSHAACDVLAKLPRISGERVFPASRGGPNTVLHLKKFWPR